MSVEPEGSLAIRSVKTITTQSLSLAYEEHGDAGGRAVVLLHGFPYAPPAYDAVVPALASQDLRIIVPYLRGFGPTRFLDASTPRSGEQAALGTDLIEMIEALGLDRPVVAGYDWGGRAACVAAAVRPDLVRGLVTGGGYNIFGAPNPQPLPPEIEHVLWYQYYLHTERGRAMLETNRLGFCKLLWKLWSPKWNFDDATFVQSAEAFDNPDFVNVVLHSYRHRFGLVPGDPSLHDLATRLENEQPGINVPTIALYGGAGLLPPSTNHQRNRFKGIWESRIVADTGHNIPQEAPEEFAAAVRDLAAG